MVTFPSLHMGHDPMPTEGWCSYYKDKWVLFSCNPSIAQTIILGGHPRLLFFLSSDSKPPRNCIGSTFTFHYLHWSYASPCPDTSPLIYFKGFRTSLPSFFSFWLCNLALKVITLKHKHIMPLLFSKILKWLPISLSINRSLYNALKDLQHWVLLLSPL